MNASGGFRLPHGSERVFFIVDGNYLRQPYHLEPPTRQHPNKFVMELFLSVSWRIKEAPRVEGKKRVI